MREFVRGAALLGRGFGFWRRRPGLMMLGLLPAAIVGALFLARLIALSASLPGLTDAMTPFADAWPSLWATVFRIAVGTALLGSALVLVVVTFTALTLLVGDPFYERIWRAVERMPEPRLPTPATVSGARSPTGCPLSAAGWGSHCSLRSSRSCRW